jgi:5'-nucleotidase
MIRCNALLILSLAILASACSSPDTRPADADIVISVIGTNDVHGEMLAAEDRGGLATISGYADALRRAHQANGDSVLLIDAGDMWQGTLESNLSEGRSMVEAYNAMGYAAVAIGNHEFDFGPTGPLATPRDADDDPHGALKQRISEADFPFLAANLVDLETGELVDWRNVKPSVLLDVQGVKVGVIGVTTRSALRTTIAANVRGLAVTPLADAINREARKLRQQGATLVVVTAHAGSYCTEFTDPADTSSCNMQGEIMQVAQQLEAGLVDHVIGGHVHEKIAHSVNGIAVTASHSHARAFGRVDFTIARDNGKILQRRIFPPQIPCPYVDSSNGSCAWSGSDDVTRASYEGEPVVANMAVVAAAEAADALVAREKKRKLGVVLETPFTLEGNPESALGNLVTDALLAKVDGDVAIHNVTGGIRRGLPEGELTFGSVYLMSPFDNQVVVLDMAGKDLRKIVAAQAHNHRRRAGIAGMQVVISCNSDTMRVDMTLSDGRRVADEDRVRVIANDFLALGGDNILTPAMPDGGFTWPAPVQTTRGVLVEWFEQQQGRLHARDFQSDKPRWVIPDGLPESCQLQP